MKLLVIIGAADFENDIKKMLEKAGVPIFSRVEISGHRNNPEEDLSQNWFAVSNGYQESVLFFSFTHQETAKAAMVLVEEFNHSITSSSRIKSFMLAVEAHN